jgi:hypothetical protein
MLQRAESGAGAGTSGRQGSGGGGGEQRRRCVNAACSYSQPDDHLPPKLRAVAEWPVQARLGFRVYSKLIPYQAATRLLTHTHTPSSPAQARRFFEEGRIKAMRALAGVLASGAADAAAAAGGSGQEQVRVCACACAGVLVSGAAGAAAAPGGGDTQAEQVGSTALIHRFTAECSP